MPVELRAFIAIELPEPVKAGLAGIQEELRRQSPPRAVRWVRADGMHLTLKFLGQTSTDGIETIAQALTQACSAFAPFSYTVSELGCFPHLGRPRVVWVGVQEDTGALTGLQGAIDTTCAEFGFKAEKRRFHPHVTLGRLRDRVSADHRSAVGQVVGRLEVRPLGPARVEAVSLIRSDLRPTGAVYTTLREMELAKSPSDPRKET